MLYRSNLNGLVDGVEKCAFPFFVLFCFDLAFISQVVIMQILQGDLIIP